MKKIIFFLFCLNGILWNQILFSGDFSLDYPEEIALEGSIEEGNGVDAPGAFAAGAVGEIRREGEEPIRSVRPYPANRQFNEKPFTNHGANFDHNDFRQGHGFRRR